MSEGQIREEALGENITILRFKINTGDVYFFVIFGDLPQVILTTPFVNSLNFTRDYKEVHKYIIDS